MNTYEVLYLDDEMNVTAARKIEAANISEALLLITSMTWPPATSSISIMRREMEDESFIKRP